jgi:hypothetical protein
MGTFGPCVYIRRMPRIQAYLPADLYDAVKERGLSPSELLQRAVRSELRRLDLLAETDGYLKDLVRRVGSPSARERAQAEAWAKRITTRGRRKAG